MWGLQVYSSIQFLKIYSKHGMHNSKSYMPTYVHCTMITIAKIWKPPKYQQQSRYKILYIHTVDCYSNIKINYIFF